MPKYITKLILAALLITSMTLVGCNKDLVDTVYSYDTAIISLPDGTIVKGNVDTWRDYDDGEQIQVMIDGVTYLVHAENAALISE